ncbi:MAG: NADH-quinone oxidoreductase subunit J [Gammaproteobacteria bacterium]|nr:NADH-quinone oxidoreductase subunit J [Gammaproteobacteria bacterium]MBT3722483.1 NADH-quinone oxidoreductase subunit J [Gammaproteobacteria bacterium]MBT4077450.1 NADH-quinone oxidoreductase subunit J [Gammaproteobacteria bacterium]MBT4196973.1 NADH-quinone oxidoreductase subunit J [Gammaproteobacteria bacterium]MBT4451829.1 NADH-quinone oxidoreductase subunit J [Gammaproteobacteria bacterium]
MMIESLVFYFFAAITIVSAGAVITARNPVHAALSLVLTFFSSAFIWMLLEAEFLAITLVLVYVGAVMVLFLFVVMMLDINIARIREGFIKFLPVGIALALIMFGLIYYVVSGDQFSLESMAAPVAKAADYSNTKELGMVLYTEYVFAFEIAAVILLVAIIAAISLTLRRRPGTRYQNPSEQMKVQKQDRLRIVKMEAEKK